MAITPGRIAKMADDIVDSMRVAAEGEIDSLVLVDQSLDAIVDALGVIEENLPKVKAENVPEQAALDNLKETFSNGVKPYVADMLKVIETFGGE